MFEILMLPPAIGEIALASAALYCLVYERKDEEALPHGVTARVVGVARAVWPTISRVAPSATYEHGVTNILKLR